jgi:hypothetical protein
MLYANVFLLTSVYNVLLLPSQFRDIILLVRELRRRVPPEGFQWYRERCFAGAAISRGACQCQLNESQSYVQL